MFIANRDSTDVRVISDKTDQVIAPSVAGASAGGVVVFRGGADASRELTLV